MKKSKQNLTIGNGLPYRAEAEQNIVPLNHRELIQEFEKEAILEINSRSQRNEEERLEEINDKRIKAEAYLAEVKYLTRIKTKEETEKERKEQDKEIAARIAEKLEDYERQKKRDEGKLIAVTDYRRRQQFDCPEHLSQGLKSKAIDTSAKLHAFVEMLTENEEIPLEIVKTTLQNLLKNINYKMKLREEEIERSIVNMSFSKKKEVKQKAIETRQLELAWKKPTRIANRRTKLQKDVVAEHGQG
jgi:hypothetical protein